MFGNQKEINRQKKVFIGCSKSFLIPVKNSSLKPVTQGLFMNWIPYWKRVFDCYTKFVVDIELNQGTQHGEMGRFAHHGISVCVRDNWLWVNSTLFRAYLVIFLETLVECKKSNMYYLIKSCIIDPVCSPYWTWWIQLKEILL